MKTKIFLFPLFTTLLFLIPNESKALTTKQLFEICASNNKPCKELAMVNAYLGGAFDLLGTLKDETNYLKKIYCDSPQSLFDTTKVLEYMEKHKEGYLNKNAMLLVIRYLEENGNCK